MTELMEATIRYHREEGRKEGVAQERKEREKERKEYEQERKDAARAMAQDGLSKAKIAKYLRVDKATLDAWLAEK